MSCLEVDQSSKTYIHCKFGIGPFKEMSEVVRIWHGMSPYVAHFREKKHWRSRKALWGQIQEKSVGRLRQIQQALNSHILIKNGWWHDKFKFLVPTTCLYNELSFSEQLYTEEFVHTCSCLGVCTRDLVPWWCTSTNIQSWSTWFGILEYNAPFLLYKDWILEGPVMRISNIAMIEHSLVKSNSSPAKSVQIQWWGFTYSIDILLSCWPSSKYLNRWKTGCVRA